MNAEQTKHIEALAVRDHIDEVQSMSLFTQEWGWETSPAIYDFEKDLTAELLLIGKGPDVEWESTDKASREVVIKMLPSWLAKNRNGEIISFLSSSQLDRKLAPFIGGLVRVTYRGKMEGKDGHFYKQFDVEGIRADRVRAMQAT